MCTRQESRHFNGRAGSGTARGGADLQFPAAEQVRLRVILHRLVGQQDLLQRVEAAVRAPAESCTESGAGRGEPQGGACQGCA